MQLIHTLLWLTSYAVVISGSACSDHSYRSLAGYSPAQEYCARHHPQPVVAVPWSPNLQRRDDEPQPVCRRLDSSDSVDSKEKLWSNLKARGDKVVSEACHCINPPKTTTLHPSRTTKIKSPSTSKGHSSRTTKGHTSTAKAHTTPKWNDWTGVKTSHTTKPGTSQKTSSTKSGRTRTSSSEMTKDRTSKTSRRSAPTTVSTTASTTASTTRSRTSKTISSTRSTASSSTRSSTSPNTSSSSSTTRSTTSSSTRSSTSSLTTTSSTTRASTSTTIRTSTTSSTTTSSPTPSCNAGSPPTKSCLGQSTCQFQFQTCSTQPDQASCQSQCDNTASCVAFNYNPTTGKCATYANCDCPTTCPAGNKPTPPQKDCQPGFCSRTEAGCSLQPDQNSCAQKCDQTPGCIAFNYNPNTATCYTYGDCTCPTTCDATRPAPAQKDCQPGTCSRTEINCSLQNSNTDCQVECNNTPGCIAVNYNGLTDQCVTYGDCTCPTTCGTDRPTPIQKDCQPGFCPRNEINCSLQSSTSACQVNCNNTPGCIAVNYNGNTGYCVTYGDCTCPTTCGTDRPFPAQKDCGSGRTCSRAEIGCSLQNSNGDCQIKCDGTPGCIAVNFSAGDDYCVTYGDCSCPAARRGVLRRGRG